MSEQPDNQPTVFLRRGETYGSRPPARVWPLVIFALLAAGFLAWTWFGRDVPRQAKVLSTAVTVIVAVLFFVLWSFLFSRLRWTLRVLLGGGFLGLLVVAGSMVRVATFSGDLVPQFEWRWSRALREARVSGANSPAAVTNEFARLDLRDFAQFDGPLRNGVADAPALATDWAAQPPRELWRRLVGAGWAGFAVSGRHAVTLEQIDGDEAVSCYELLTGEVRWRYRYPARYETPIGGTGPRSVPLIVSNRVYAVGATGFLSCLNLENGDKVWSENILTANDAPVREWGFACSPLFHEGRIIVNPGGTGGRSLVAYDAETGAKVWGGGDAAASYSSPAVVTLSGVEQVLSFNQPRISSHLPATGEVLWEYPWGKGQPQVALPMVTSSNEVLFSSGYGIGAELLRVTHDDAGKWQVEQAWKSIRMKAKFANLVWKDGFVYGLDDGILACLDPADGSQRWKEGRYGHGQLLLVNDLLLVTAENGEVILLKPTPEAPNELTRFAAFDHKQWNPPALAGQVLVVRTDREAACFVLPLGEKEKGVAAPDPAE